MTQDKSAPRGAPGASTAGSTPSTIGAGPATTGDVAAQARAAARQTADQAKDKAGELAGQAREQIDSQLASQKDRVAEGLGSVAQALRQTGDGLRERDQHGLTGYVERAADQVESLSSYLRERDMGRMVDDVERYARREPALFLGGAFVLGLLGARFLKASRPQPRYDDSYYGTSSAYEYRRPAYGDYPTRPEYGAAAYPAGATSAGPGPDTKGRQPTGSGQSMGRGAGIYDRNREGS